MAYYIEEEAWKCPKHPSKKRRTTTTGVCSICLRDRLSKLCPHCANVRPCSSNCPASAAAASTKWSSSSSGKIGGEPAFCRSKSVGVPFLKSRNKNSSSRRNQPDSEKSNKTASFWWVFKSRKSGKENEKLESKANGGNDKYCSDTRIKEFSMTVMRSRSVNVAMTSVSGGNDVSYSPEKLKGWYLVSPMKVFRQSSKAPKLVN
ncbi:hypothetical protein HAX54_028600 [Datura stramonium]|uniref:Uncharacterized protein n=1 Tax=Datura stramonium TaxID=4076 RepID=A0ABS8V4D8_DATST|nr:hypothetical protein [Datura stramonium]